MQSMTGFGEAAFQLSGTAARIQVRSRNSRFLDIDLQFSEPLQWFEPKALQLAQSRFSRGKIEIQLTLNERSESIQLNQFVLSQYEQLFQDFYNKKKVNLPLDVLVKLPGVFQKSTEYFKDESNRLEVYFARALLRMERERNREGKKIEAWLRKSLRVLSRQNRKIELLHKRLLVRKTKDFKNNLFYLMPDLDKYSGRAIARFIWQENKETLLAQISSDITEEVERIKFHLMELQQVIQSNEPVGKKLEFYSQELLREVNTLTAKTRSTEVNQLGIDMKTEIEKIREQIRNLE